MASLEETTGAWPVYIKFNSQPTASSTGQKRGKGSTELLVNINLTLTNDLGEQRHSGDVDLEVLIRAESLNKERVFAVRWDPKQYVLKESLNCGPVSLWSNHASDTPQRIDRLICSIAAKGSAERIKQCHVIDLRRAFSSDETQIISTLSPVRSSDDSPDSSSTYTAWTERCLLLPQLSEQSETRFRQVVLPVPEERGTHLAKHIWDAGLGLTMLLAQFAEQFINHSRHQSSKLATCLLPIDHGTPTRVLELGCGTGVVGVAMAIMHANTRVILSDLVDARDGVQRLLARVGDRLNRSSECTFEVLDWMIPLETRWTEDSLDLLVVSDCTYNADTVPALVRTLRGLARLNPRAKLLLAHKIRHIDELGFYHQLGNAGWKSVEHTKFCMGSVKPAADGQTDTTSLHVYLFEWLHG